MYYLAATYTVRTMAIRQQLAKLTDPDRDRGEIPGQVIMIAGLAMLAILVVGIITSKVIGKANSINLDGNATAPANP